jgi:hypothetical protein
MTKNLAHSDKQLIHHENTYAYLNIYSKLWQHWKEKQKDYGQSMRKQKVWTHWRANGSNTHTQQQKVYFLKGTWNSL